MFSEFDSYMSKRCVKSISSATILPLHCAAMLQKHMVDCAVCIRQMALAHRHLLVMQPLLDVILFTRSLSRSMGYKGQLALYVYYLFSAGALRKLSPPLALITAQESSLSGGFRAAHQVCAL